MPHSYIKGITVVYLLVMKPIPYLILFTALLVNSLAKTNGKSTSSGNEIYVQISDSMRYEITKSFSERDLRELVLKINKEHNALLSFKDLVINDEKEIIGIDLKFIDSQIHESTYTTNENKPIDPIIVFKYGDSISGIIKKESVLKALPDNVLKRLARQDKEKKERDSLRQVYESRKIEAKKRKPKLQVKSSHTVPKSLLTAEQKQLRRLEQKDSLK